MATLMFMLLLIVVMLVRTKRLKLLAIAGVLVASELALVVFNSPVAEAALINQAVSPIPANMTKWNTNTASNTGANANTMRHVIKKEGSSTMNRVSMAAYFSEARVDNAHRIRITDRDLQDHVRPNPRNDERCAAYYTNNTVRDNFITVRLSTELRAGGTSVATYTIRGDRVCTGTRSGNNGYFFGNYTVPAGFIGTGCNTGTAKCHDETGLYRVGIEIFYNSGVPNAADDEKQQVTFRVQLDAGCGATCVRYLSIVQASSPGDRNYSTLGEFREYGNPWYTDQGFQFGLPCSQREEARNTISLYDIDNQGAGGQNGTWGEPGDDTTFQIQRRVGNNWVAQSYTTSGNPNSANYVSTTNVTVSGTTFTPQSGSGITASVRFLMLPSENYRVKLLRVHNRNLVGVGLPTETIYGDISCDYELRPNMNAVPSTIVPGGTASGLTGLVNNSLSTTSYGNPQSGVVRFVVPAGTTFSELSGTTTLSGAGANLANSAGCRIATGVVGSSRNCTVFGAAGRTYPQGSTTVWSGSDTLTGIPLTGGDRVCYMTIVNLYNQPASTLDWRYSQIRCALVLTQPKVALWGNDLRVGSSFSGGTNLNASANAIVASDSASWVEYAITAPAAVTGLASQSGAVNGSPDPQSSWSRLTFANTGVSPGCPGGYGCFAGATALGKIPDVRTAVNTMSYGGSALNRNVGATSFAASGIAGIIGGADLGNFTRSASITTTGTITIDQDIVYDSGTLSGEGAIPQLILVGNNINITGNVRRIDAWLIATGTVTTCSDVANQAALRSNNCNNPLRINGPVMAGQLALNRTFADTSNANEAAETINLRGDAYIWASRAARQNGHWQTVYTTELPPRY